MFNGDVINGIPALEKTEINPMEKVDRVEQLLDYWNENEAKIVYGGSQAYYRPKTDEIHLPDREKFFSMQEFYSTALHELGHSTGHESRLNRNIENLFGTPDYALEELRAEIASMFIEQDLEIQLGNAVFRNPAAVNPEDKYSGFETAEEYLSGRVADKLQMAERMKQSSPDLIDYDKNIAALKEVQPAPVKASEIAVRVGTSWIDKELYKEFFCQLIALPYYMRDGIELYYNKHDGSWRVDRTTGYVRNFRTMNVTSVYGTERANAYRLFEDCLNQRSTQIYDTVLDADGREKRVLNNSETVAAREKQNKIVEAFKDWIFRDPERREELEGVYNRLFNQIRLPKYDGTAQSV